MKKFRNVLAVMLAIAMVLTVGCSAKTNAPDSGTDTPKEVKDTIIIAQGADAKSLDPYGTTDSPAGRVASCIFDTLVTRDDEGNVAPGLAESWEIVDDTTYIFHLRKGVKFHNGEEFKASDVAFSFSQIAQSPHAESIRATIDFEKSKVIDDYTFEMKMTEPFGPILNHLGHVVMSIVNEKAYTEAGDKVGQNPVGTGPYKFVSWTTGDRIDLIANEDYWGNKPKIKNVVFRSIPEIASRSIEVETGGIDVSIDVQASELSRLESNKDVKVFRRQASRINFLCFNCKKAPFDNIKVRQAINMAINKEAIFNVVYQGVGSIASAPMSSVVWSFNDKLAPHEYNIEKAKALLAEAGYPNGLEITISCDQNQERLDTAEMAQAQLSEIGVKANIETLERGAFIDKVIGGNLEMFGLGWTSDTGDPDYSLYASFHSSMHGAGGNMSFYTNKKVDELLQLGRSSTDPEVRKNAYFEAQEIVWEEVPCVFLQCPEEVVVYNANIQGFGVYDDGQLKIEDFYF
ncbi:glutathione ABC transporter substrate-binding protein [Lutispora sp.]|uniref:glutathione ABC transporter substrate-binding protein n=1 Tax=Lutispora sp. TaxID=2828727 RepID=UPI002B213905|nr:glutathione ABC transporter substrate-binding protein [Lutispora sp.]MEA4962333.1 glutathione ABC transporter substrate-binding protein [Lutispora sp.]